MKELKIMPSDPRYEAINELMTLLAMANNPSMHFLTWGMGDNPIDITTKMFEDQVAADDLKAKLLDAIAKLMK